MTSARLIRPLPAPDLVGPIRLLRKTLVALVLLLVFEGLFRKLEPNKIGVLIFLLKDAVVLFLGFQLATRHRLPAAINFLWFAYLTVIVFFLPNILITASHDPLLAVFGAKEYLLYPIVALAVFVAFEKATLSEIVGFCRIVAVLMIPAGLTALLQTQLSPSHWLNLSVDGASLEDFSSAGHLRVSGTFSFVAQFCGFLNVEMFMIFLALHGWNKLPVSRRWLYLAPIPLVVVCSYLTGSRGAVVGNTMVLVIAAVLALLRGEVGKIFRLVWIIGGVATVALIFQAVAPSLMATYSVREQGHVFGVSSEIQDRVYSAFFGWIDDIDRVPFFGNGLGIMSNGSDAISAYSRTFRIAGWTETDFATTLFEGGPYLILVWYAFRYFVIFETSRRFIFQIDPRFSLPASFCQAYVILVGLTGTLGIQPPTAIWWWLAVGLSTVLWWRSVHPLEATGEISAPPVKTTPRPFASSRRPAPAASPAPPVATAAEPPAKVSAPRRGRSAYAERLHDETNAKP